MWREETGSPSAFSTALAPHSFNVFPSLFFFPSLTSLPSPSQGHTPSFLVFMPSPQSPEEALAYLGQRPRTLQPPVPGTGKSSPLRASWRFLPLSSSNALPRSLLFNYQIQSHFLQEALLVGAGLDLSLILCPCSEVPFVILIMI